MSKSRKAWTQEHSRLLAQKVQECSKLSIAFMAVSEATGHSVKSVENHYYRQRSEHVEQNENSAPKRWTEEEEQRLIRQMTAFPQNVRKACFLVAEELGRSRNAVITHWYSVTSKRDDVMCFFTASTKHISRNRKNSVGVESTPSVWRRLLRVIQDIIK